MFIKFNTSLIQLNHVESTCFDSSRVVISPSSKPFRKDLRCRRLLNVFGRLYGKLMQALAMFASFCGSRCALYVEICRDLPATSWLLNILEVEVPMTTHLVEHRPQPSSAQAAQGRPSLAVSFWCMSTIERSLACDGMWWNTCNYKKISGDFPL